MIQISEKAAGQAQKLMSENDIDPAIAGVKLSVKAGGCSGLNYLLDIVESPEDNDRVFTQNGVNLFCDPKSYLYLNGTEIDFEGGMTGGFKFNNPNAKRSCGCGTSFSV